MLSCRKPRLAPLGALAALAVGAPAADAAVPKLSLKSPAAYARLQAAYPVVPGAGCANTNGGTDIEGQGRSGGNDIFACGNVGLTFIGPATAINSTVGPTIISPGFVGTVITTNGNIAIVP